MSIYKTNLMAEIKSLQKTKSAIYQQVLRLRLKEENEIAEFKKKMETKPSFKDFAPPFQLNVSAKDRKHLEANARIEYKAALLLWENFHAIGEYPEEIHRIKAAKKLAIEELQAAQEQLAKQKGLLRANKINEAFQYQWDVENVILPFVEKTIPKLLNEYKSLGRLFNQAIELYNEGGHVKSIGMSEWNELTSSAGRFLKDVILLQETIRYNSSISGSNLWTSDEMKDLVKNFELLIANVNEFFRSFNKPLEQLANNGTEWLILDSYGKCTAGSIFNCLIDQSLVDQFIDESLTDEAFENARNNLLDRVKFCWKNHIDFSFDEFVHLGQKMDKLAGIKNVVVDVAFDSNLYQTLKEKVDKVNLTTNLEIIQQAQKAKIAGNVYRPIPTLTFEESVAEPYINSTYGVRSIVEKYAPNMLLKVDKKGEVDGMGWIGDTTAAYMNYSLLMSAGGGRVFMNKAAMIAFAAISNSLVDVKAYIASVAGSSCIEEKQVTSAIGVKLWIYVDKDGNPIKGADGRIRGKKNSNEGSSWNGWGGTFPYQERTVANEWIKFIQKVNEAQTDFSLNFRNKVRALKEGIRIDLAIRGCYKNPNVKFTGKYSRLNDVVGIQFMEGITAKDSCNGKSFSFANITIHSTKGGAKYVVLPMIGSKEATKLLVEKAPQVDFVSEVEGIVNVKPVKDGARWALTFLALLVESQKRCLLEGIDFDWTERFKSGSDPMVTAHVKKYSKKSWNWKTASIRRDTLDRHYAEAMDNFATIVCNGKTIVDLRKEMEDSVIWPMFEGLKTLWGIVPPLTQKVIDEIEFVKAGRINPNWETEKAELLKSFPKLVAARLEQAVELESFDPDIWSNTLATAIIGKGKSLPIDIHRGFIPWNDKISPDDLKGEVTADEKRKWAAVSFVKNKDDGADKSYSYKGVLKKAGEAELAKVFDLDDEKSANCGERMISIGYMFGEPMDVTVAIMRRMKLGRVGATFQATEKKPTTLHGSGLAGEATEESTISFKEYWGILPCGGTMSRTELPQIPNKLRESFLDSLEVDYEDVIAKPMDLQPLQEFVSEANSKSNKPLLISLDGFIIDGHHRWYANKDNDSITCVIVHMLKDELLEKAKAFEGVYYAKPSRFELVKEFFGLVAKLPMATSDGSKLSDFQYDLDPYDLLLPGKLYLNMMEALCRIESAEVFERINDNIANSLDGELLKVYKAMGCNINDSAKLTTKQIDSINAKLSDFVRGAVIKAVNIPVHVFDAIEEGVIILPPRLRTKTHSGNLALAFRYPIASATSVGIVRVVFGDDPAVKPLLESYGIDFSQYPDVLFMSAGDKSNYQFDDDGDTFGILFEPAFNLKDWKLSIARALNEFEGTFSKKAIREDGTINKRKYSKKLWTTVKSWVGIGMNLLQRGDYDSQNIEMPDISTDNNKKSMQIMDLRGYCTEEFRKLSHKDARGPVGLISDLFTVILASSAQGTEFTRLACVCGYILQHCIDSAKKEKLVIPAAILLNPVVWLEVEGKWELRPEVNAIILKWNEAYAEMDKAKILELEANANNMFKDETGSSIAWLPTIEKIEGNCKIDDQVLFFAPSTLLANMSEVAKKGCYGTFDFFGTPIPVHPKLADATDPTRYIPAHTLEIHQFTDEDGKIVPWKAFSAFRKINVKAFAHFESKFQFEGLDENSKAKWSNWVEWSERTDANNFPAYFTDLFVGNEWESYPNLVFKHVLRWAIELCWNGKEKLQEYSKLFNEDNRMKKQDFVQPQFPWTIKKSTVLLPEADKTVVKMVAGEYSYTVDNRLAKELNMFFVENVVYYKGKSNKKWSIELLKLIQPWVKEPMSLSSVIEAEEFDKNSFYINYTRLMRQVGLLLLAAPQYKEVDAEHYAYIKTLSKNSSEFKQLTQWTIGETVYDWSPNPITQRLVSIVNARYKDAITKNGRNPEETWMPSFKNFTKAKGYKGKILNNYQLKPSWYVGSDADWIDEMKANVTDVVVSSLTRHIQIYSCELTEALIDDLKKIEDLHVHVRDESKQVNPFTQILMQHDIKHFNITGKSYLECECCQSNIRKLITSVARDEEVDVGTKRYREITAKKANVYVAQQLIEAVKAQSKLLVEEAIENDNFEFENNRFGLQTETILGYVEDFGTDFEKAKFGLPLRSDYILFELWDDSWKMLGRNLKGLFIQLIEKELDTKWWNAPIGFLVHNLEAFMISKKLIKAKGEDTKQWISLSKWTEKTEDDDPDNDPTSPKAKQVQSAEDAFGSAKVDASASASASKSIKLMVTGHRVVQDEAWVKQELVRVLEKLKGMYAIEEAISGMALGVDTWFAQEVKSQGLNLHCYLPCKGQQRSWNEADQEVFKQLVRTSKFQLITKGLYEDGCMKKRNQAMVRDCDWAIVVFEGNQKSGTAQTLRMLEKANKPHIVVNSETKTTTIRR